MENYQILFFFVGNLFTLVGAHIWQLVAMGLLCLCLSVAMAVSDELAITPLPDILFEPIVSNPDEWWI